MDYYNDDEYLQEELFYDDEENSYMNYLAYRRRKKKERLTQYNMCDDLCRYDYSENPYTECGKNLIFY